MTSSNPVRSVVRNVAGRSRRASAFETALLAVATVPALAVAWSLFRVFWSRLTYGIDAELMEGGALLQAYRVMHGLPLYPKPGSGFMPYAYPPLHTWTLALLGELFGLGFGTARALSIASVVVVTGVLAREVYASHGRTLSAVFFAVLAVGFVCVGFPLTGGMYDLARIDAFALALAVVSAVVCVGSGRAPVSRTRLVVGVALLVATAFTKQTHVAFVAWIILCLGLVQPRTAMRVGAGVLGAGISVWLALELGTHGHFAFYAVGAFSHERVSPARVGVGVVQLVRFAPYLGLLPIGVLLLFLKRVTIRSRLWLGMLVAALPVTLVPYGKFAGSINTFYPVVVLGGPVFLCVLGDLLPPSSSLPKTTRLARVGVALGSAFYIGTHLFDPTPYFATEPHRAAVAAFDQYVAGLKGGALLPSRPFNAIIAKQPTEQAHDVPWWDYWFTDDTSAPFERFLERTNPAWIVLTGEEPSNLVQAMSARYFLRRVMPEETRLAETLPFGSAYGAFLLERDTPDPPHTRCLFDFETATYEGFRAEGTAFDDGPHPVPSATGPVALSFAVHSVVVGAEGNFFASSANDSEGDLATGTLTSPRFVIDGPSLRMRFAGASDHDVRVELRVDGAKPLAAFGHGPDYMADVTWDVDADRGKKAKLVVIDDDVHGHAVFDRVRLVGSDGADDLCQKPRATP